MFALMESILGVMGLNLSLSLPAALISGSAKNATSMNMEKRKISFFIVLCGLKGVIFHKRQHHGDAGQRYADDHRETFGAEILQKP